MKLLKILAFIITFISLEAKDCELYCGDVEKKCINNCRVPDYSYCIEMCGREGESCGKECYKPTNTIEASNESLKKDSLNKETSNLIFLS